MSRPLLLLSLALAAGAVAGQSLGLTVARLLLCLAALLLALALASSRLPGATIALCGAAVAMGAAAAAVEGAAYCSSPLFRLVEVEADPERSWLLVGAAAADARESEDRWILLLDVESVQAESRSERAWGRVRVEVSGLARRPEIVAGDRISVWAQLRAPRGFANPGGFDTVDHARREGLHAFAHCKSPLLVTRQAGAWTGGLRGLAASVRRWGRGVFQAHMIPGPEQGLVKAMVLGDRSGVDAVTAEDFRVAGTYHVLALSGAQVALLAGLLLWGLRRLALPPVPTALLVSGALLFYAELVGGEVPIVRAAAMAIVLILGRALDLDSDLSNLLGLAAGLLVVQRPSAILDVSFQLSFAATLGILLLAPPLLARAPRLPLRLELALAASLAAQAALLPLLIFHFHRLAPAALLLNLAAIPLSGAVLLAGLALLVGSLLATPLVPLLSDLAWVAAHALLRSAQPVRWFPALDARVSTPPFWAVALYVVGLWSILDRSRWGRGLLLGALGLAGLLLGRAPVPADGRLHLTALDVGQGDCLVVRSPQGGVWMVDAGGSFDPRFDMGEAVVGPYLWSQGVRRIDGLLLTHAHPDHVGGAPSLLRSFRVKEVWEGPAPRHDPTYAQLDARLCRSTVTRKTVVQGLRLDWQGLRLEVRGPRPPPRAPWKTRNDDSVILTLAMGDVVFLLAGDLEAKGERELGVLPASVLKVPHHGSRTSSSASFVSAVSPSVAVVSVGHRSRFGHPHPEVLDRYRRAGCRVFRTDRDGAVTVSTDGQRIWVRTFKGGVEQRLR